MTLGQASPSTSGHTGNLADLSGALSLRCPQIETAAYVGTGRHVLNGVALFKLASQV
jgi:hypothetical protein